MAEFSRLIITKQGQALIADTLAGSEEIVFSRVGSTDTVYELDQLEALTEILDIKQDREVSRVSKINEVTVKIETAFTNEELTVGYHMRALGLYAVADGEEMLFAVAIEISGNCYMPAYGGVTVSGAYVNFVTAVGNAEKVYLEINNSASATIWDIKDLQEQINALGSQMGGIPSGIPSEIYKIGTMVYSRDIRFTKSNISNQETLQIGHFYEDDLSGLDPNGRFLYILEPDPGLVQTITFKGSAFRHVVGHLDFEIMRYGLYYQRASAPLCSYRPPSLIYTAPTRLVGYLDSVNTLRNLEIQAKPYFAEIINSALVGVSDGFTILVNWQIRVLQIGADMSGATGGGGGTSGTSDYKALVNKPVINDVTLVGHLTTKDLGLEANKEMSSEEMDAILT